MENSLAYIDLAKNYMLYNERDYFQLNKKEIIIMGKKMAKAFLQGLLEGAVSGVIVGACTLPAFYGGRVLAINVVEVLDKNFDW